MKTIWIILLSLFVGGLLSTMLMRSCQIETPPEIQTITDTLTITRIDTIVQVLPQPIKVVRDTIKLNDTVYIGGQTFYQEIKEYKDSTYYAKISGINAYLEEIRVYPKTITQYINTKEYIYVPPKKWSIGIQGGIGITPVGLQPYIGFGVQRKIEF